MLDLTNSNVQAFDTVITSTSGFVTDLTHLSYGQDDNIVNFTPDEPTFDWSDLTQSEW